MERLPACNYCKYQLVKDTYWEYERRCLASPAPRIFDCSTGRWVVPFYKLCKDVNTDGTCDCFKKKLPKKPNKIQEKFLPRIIFVISISLVVVLYYLALTL